jgi:hypothetical protein
MRQKGDPALRSTSCFFFNQRSNLGFERLGGITKVILSLEPGKRRALGLPEPSPGEHFI